jgi:hypothetical protein
VKIPYRKLPGHRRGFVRGSSVWLGDDHLLLVRSSRVREEYKRFLFRDIQAIVIASMPRFFLSTRAGVLGVLWVVAYFATRNLAQWAPAVLWSVAICLVGAWIYVSALRSCTCRIFTAVSRDDLPSLYRTWTARRFLAQVEPLIAEAQGVLEPSWADAMESRTVGPPPAPVTASAGSAQRAERSRTLVTDLFLGSLFAHAAYILLTIHSVSNNSEWIGYSFAAVEFVFAILVFLQYRRGILGPAIPKLAIAALLTVGASYYGSQIIYSIVTATSPGDFAVMDRKVLTQQRAYVLLSQADAAVTGALGIAGVVLSFRKPRK